MARRIRKGYFVDGEFVAEGSAADQAFRQELAGTGEVSRTSRKEASEKLQDLGEELLTLRQDLFDGLALPERLREALVEAKRLSSRGAIRRQKQLIGSLMHRLDPSGLEAVQAALDIQRSQSALDTRRLHQAERWRDELIGDDTRLGAWLAEFPGTDAQHLRALIRQARKDAREAQPGEGARKGRAYRQIFDLVRAGLRDGPEAGSG